MFLSSASFSNAALCQYSTHRSLPPADCRFGSITHSLAASFSDIYGCHCWFICTIAIFMPARGKINHIFCHFLRIWLAWTVADALLKLVAADLISYKFWIHLLFKGAVAIGSEGLKSFEVITQRFVGEIWLASHVDYHQQRMVFLDWLYAYLVH